ncbi:MAG: T9SS type A sorting domain-containing protein [Bacteroidetes bacterium]|nr:T9SS type A sorting domain-containing protein [Bacteroidota bacterium]
MNPKQMMMKNILFLTIAFLCVHNLKAQTNYYVDDVSGNNTNSGTSLAAAWKTIQKSANSATPNSTVYIKAGTYHENVVINVNGTVNNPITFRNYQSDIVMIDGVGTAGNTLLSISNKNYLNFLNLIIQNKTVNNAQGILVETTGLGTSTMLSFKNIVIKNINWNNNASAIPSAADNSQGFIAYGRNGGITNLTIDSCQVFNNILGFSEAISLDGNINGFIVKSCKVHDNTNIGIALIGNYITSTVPATDHARNGVINYNECYNNISLYATSGGIYVDGGKSIVVEKNKCYGNGNGIEVGCEENGTTDSIIVKNNLLYNNQNVGIYVGGYTTATTGQVLNTIIRNNTLFQNNYANNGTGEMNISKASNCKFENNVFYTTAQSVLLTRDNISPQNGNVYNYNCWYTPSGNPNAISVNWGNTVYSSFTAYKTGASQESNSFFNNPSLINTTLATLDLHLLNSSPCVNTGKPTTTISIGETDYDGNARIINTIIDVGAFEVTAPAGIKIVTQNENKFFPNPFSVQTTLYFKFEITNAEFILYDINGRQIKEIRNLFGDRIIFERAGLDNGIYFYDVKENNNLIAKGKFLVY